MRKKHEHAEHAPRCSCLSSCSQGAFLLGNKVFGLVFPAFNRGAPGPLLSLKLRSPSIRSSMRLTGMARFSSQVSAAHWPRLGLGIWTGIGARAPIERCSILPYRWALHIQIHMYGCMYVGAYTAAVVGQHCRRRSSLRGGRAGRTHEVWGRGACARNTSTQSMHRGAAACLHAARDLSY